MLHTTAFAEDLLNREPETAQPDVIIDAKVPCLFKCLFRSDKIWKQRLALSQ